MAALNEEEHDCDVCGAQTANTAGFNCQRWRESSLDIEGDGLARQGLHEDLHTTTKTQHNVEGGLLLDVIVRQGAARHGCKDMVKA